MKLAEASTVIRYKIYNDELTAWSAKYTGPKFMAVLCDPPYGLEFMGKEWDSYAWDARRNTEAAKLVGSGSIRNAPIYKAGKGFQQAVTGWGEAILPHLYPGALVLMFGGTRTWHRLACGMEDAGFEIWDTLMWLHGQGFPKAQDISKLIDKANGDERKTIAIGSDGATRAPRAMAPGGAARTAVQTISEPATRISAPWSGHKTTALKPAWEPVLCFKKPLTGTYAEMALQYGSGALNVDGGRIAGPPTTHGGVRQKATIYAGAFQVGKEDFRESPLGRYPANLILECTCEQTETVSVRDGVAVKRNLDGHTYNEHQEWGMRAKAGLDVYKGGKMQRSEFFDDEAKKNQWNAFINKNRLYVPAISLQEAVADIERFVMPLIAPTQEEGQRVRTWPPGGPWSKNTVEQG
jgi:site-specific DNA-methyltransferase (adenine-specific)